jgi:hypothetical protein
MIYKRIQSALILTAAILSTPLPLFPTSVTLGWQPNQEQDLAGYRLFYGTKSGAYDVSVDAGNTIEHTVDGLDIGTRYYFSLKAYDTSGNESGFCEEVSYTPESDAGDIMTLTVPNGGENVRAGARYTLIWQAHREIEEIRIWLSTDDGSTWDMIESHTDNDGSWTWDVPGIHSGECIVKLEKYGNPDIYDYSDACFSIEENGDDYDEDLCLLNPQGGERIVAGSEFTITWNTNPDIQEIRIWLSADNGYTWEMIEDRTPNDGSWTWDVPFRRSDLCIMKLEKYGNSSIYDYSDACFSIEGLVGVDDDETSGLPRTVELFQNYPNPFNPSTQISYTVPTDGTGGDQHHVSMVIYNVRGKMVKQLVDGRLSPGRYTTHWNGRTDWGETAPSGVYLYLLSVDGEASPPRKMSLAR